MTKAAGRPGCGRNGKRTARLESPSASPHRNTARIASSTLPLPSSLASANSSIGTTTMVAKPLVSPVTKPLNSPTARWPRAIEFLPHRYSEVRVEGALRHLEQQFSRDGGGDGERLGLHIVERAADDADVGSLERHGKFAGDLAGGLDDDYRGHACSQGIGGQRVPPKQKGRALTRPFAQEPTTDRLRGSRLS